jgi:hypothetical protein
MLMEFNLLLRLEIYSFFYMKLNTPTNIWSLYRLIVLTEIIVDIAIFAQKGLLNIVPSTFKDVFLGFKLTVLFHDLELYHRRLSCGVFDQRAKHASRFNPIKMELFLTIILYTID